MIVFLIGCMVGGTVGIFTMCLCRVASDADNVWIPQILTSKFVRFGDTILIKNVVFLLSERSVKICQQ